MKRDPLGSDLIGILSGLLEVPVSEEVINFCAGQSDRTSRGVEGNKDLFSLRSWGQSLGADGNPQVGRTDNLDEETNHA